MFILSEKIIHNNVNYMTKFWKLKYKITVHLIRAT